MKDFIARLKFLNPDYNETCHLEIFKTHATSISNICDIDYKSVLKLYDGLYGSAMRNIWTQAGLFSIWANKDYGLEDDFMS